MCGIAARYSKKNRHENIELIRKMSMHLRHRGPNDEGYFFFDEKSGNSEVTGGADTPDNVLAADIEYCPKGSKTKLDTAVLALCHRRLSILDLSPAGHQPMSYADGRYWIVFNGEIYNFIELRSELSTLGYKFKSTSDTEVLLAAYDQWGVESLKKLIGMWAFVLFDKQKKIIFASRDPFGIKPLYYHVKKDGDWIFSSEINSMFSDPELDRTSYDDCSLYNYFRYGITGVGKETFYKDVKQLEPGQYIRFKLGEQIDPQTYWSAGNKTLLKPNLTNAAHSFGEMMKESVSLHMRSDVPLAAALSGGLDSSSIVSLVKKIDPQYALTCFSFIPRNHEKSEEKWIDMVIADTGYKSVRCYVSPEDMASNFERLIRIQQEPIPSSSIFAQLWIYKYAKEAGFRVMLDGQGGDETMSGYHFFNVVRIKDLLKMGRISSAIRLYLSLLKRDHYSPSGLLLESLILLFPAAIREQLKLRLSRNPINRFLMKDSNSLNLQTVHPMDRGDHTHDLKGYLYNSLRYSSMPGLLRYQDRNSMAYSIESRVPFLNTKITEYVYSLPDEVIISSDGVNKKLLRDAMNGILVEEVRQRKDKIGFGTPEKDWIQSMIQLCADLFADTDAMPSFVDRKAFQEYWSKFIDGKAEYNPIVWRLACYLIWNKINLEGNSENTI